MKKWDIKKLGEVCDFFNGQAHEKCIDENGKYKLINSKFVSSEGDNFKRTNNALSPLFVNDIVMVMSDVPNGKTLAKCFVVDEDDTYTLNQRICVIRSKCFDTRFLYYQLNRNKYFLSFNNGENQSNLRKDDILNCELLVPPLPEQQRIVAILDEAFTAIDKAKANAQQNLKNAKEIFESYLQGVFENKEGNWEEKKLSQISKTFGRGKSKHRPRNWDGLYGGKYPFIQTGDIRNCNHYVIEYSQTYNDVGLAQSKLWKAGTICITIAANIAETGILTFDACFPDSVIGIEVNEKYADRDFVEYLLQSFKVRIQALGKGSAQANINMGTFENELFPFPTVAEQQTIVQKLDALNTETKKLEAIYQQKINDLEELKKSILQKAFAGELKTKEAVMI
jgi:type I restriction enzyme, S subunit